MYWDVPKEDKLTYYSEYLFPQIEAWESLENEMVHVEGFILIKCTQLSKMFDICPHEIHTEPQNISISFMPNIFCPDVHK